MPANPELLDKLRGLMQRHCFQYGDFTLTSGGKSKFYYNGKLVTLRPSSATLIGAALIDVVPASGAAPVVGPALGAVPIALARRAAGPRRGRHPPARAARVGGAGRTYPGAPKKAQGRNYWGRRPLD